MLFEPALPAQTASASTPAARPCAPCRALPPATDAASCRLPSAQGRGSIAFDIYSQQLAALGLQVVDPSTLFADEGAVRALLHAAGYSAVALESSEELNVRRGQTPAQWAAGMWRAVTTMPFAPLAGLGLAPEQERELERGYLAAAEATAAGFAGPEGIAEPYTQLWVLARK